MKRNSIMEQSRKLITPEIKMKVDFAIDIANRIFDILEMKGLKQKDLAKMLGKSEAEISKWLQGTHNFTVETILKIQAKLGEDILMVAGTKKANKPKSTQFETLSINFSNQSMNLIPSPMKNIHLNTNWNTGKLNKSGHFLSSFDC
jgi:transcriptional regulator with XRE-family HTH domain